MGEEGEEEGEEGEGGGGGRGGEGGDCSGSSWRGVGWSLFGKAEFEGA